MDITGYKAFKFDPNQFPVPDFYDSPISMIINRVSNDIAKQTDDMVYKAIVNTGVNVDKDMLIRILNDDKQRYRDAYTNGYLDAMSKFTEAFNRVFAELSGEQYPDDDDDD